MFDTQFKVLTLEVLTGMGFLSQYFWRNQNNQDDGQIYETHTEIITAKNDHRSEVNIKKTQQTAIQQVGMSA